MTKVMSHPSFTHVGTHRPPRYKEGEDVGSHVVSKYLGLMIPTFANKITAHKEHCYELTCKVCGRVSRTVQSGIQGRLSTYRKRGIKLADAAGNGCQKCRGKTLKEVTNG